MLQNEISLGKSSENTTISQYHNLDFKAIDYEKNSSLLCQSFLHSSWSFTQLLFSYSNSCLLSSTYIYIEMLNSTKKNTYPVWRQGQLFNHMDIQIHILLINALYDNPVEYFRKIIRQLIQSTFITTGSLHILAISIHNY